MEQLIKQFMEKIDRRFDSLEVDINELKVGQAQLQGDVKNLQADIGDLKEGHARVEQYMIDNLQAYTDKITEYIDARTDALNKRVYRLEVEFERLYKQLKVKFPDGPK